jgi:hypothetical protein
MFLFEYIKVNEKGGALSEIGVQCSPHVVPSPTITLLHRGSHSRKMPGAGGS